MSLARKIIPDSHVVDILGSTKGRDQPVMLVEKALLLIDCFGESVLADQNTVFFDPFSKAGEVLLAAALKSCLHNKKPATPIASSEEITQELYNGRYFGLALDERHYLLSLRTFYGNERSHNAMLKKYIRNGNYLSETNGRLDESKFKEEFNGMIEFIKKNKPNCKIVAVGNPPYQESDGGFGKSAKSIYHLFAETLIDNPAINQLALVIPSRWFGGGKGLDQFRDRIIKSKNVKNLRYFKNSNEVFPTVDINGGICFIHWDKSFSGNTKFSDGTNQNEIDISQEDSSVTKFKKEAAATSLPARRRMWKFYFYMPHIGALPTSLSLAFRLTSSGLRNSRSRWYTHKALAPASVDSHC